MSFIMTDSFTYQTEYNREFFVEYEYEVEVERNGLSVDVFPTFRDILFIDGSNPHCTAEGSLFDDIWEAAEEHMNENAWSNVDAYGQQQIGIYSTAWED